MQTAMDSPADGAAAPALCRFIDRLNRQIGFALGWCVLALILLQVLLIVLQSAFQLNSVKLSELLLYLNAAIFLGGAGYALAQDEHVRVDVFYRGAPLREKAEVNAVGTLLFLLPLVALVFWSGWEYVRRSWSVLERSVESSGLPFVYILKSFILLFAVVLLLQAISLLVRSVHQRRAQRDA